MLSIIMILFQLQSANAVEMDVVMPTDDGGGGGGATVGGGTNECSVYNLDQIYREFPGIAHKNERYFALVEFLEMCPEFKGKVNF